MILEVAILDVIPGQEVKFEQAFSQAQPLIASVSGYINHDLKSASRNRIDISCWSPGKS
ncbi:hypothetical protein C1752_03702 [Acaryochloris thomasi RCC1774]|uniref:Antibiotic biosynthesis monooxygenase n=1 Tax=Acaryochloris thomasi RCC1774 TaxID=1764569 RepID=A0A2W1JG47_9CYAN|nr:hypothetical protein C1752_03702 [Acaryochloris thomasi RCC1774]